jgi:hypothetical protein
LSASSKLDRLYTLIMIEHLLNQLCKISSSPILNKFGEPTSWNTIRKNVLCRFVPKQRYKHDSKMNSLLVEGDLTTVVPTNICEVVEIDSKKYEVYSSTPWRDADSIIGYYSELIAKL